MQARGFKGSPESQASRFLPHGSLVFPPLVLASYTSVPETA